MPNRAAVEDRWHVVKRVFNKDTTRSHNLDQKIFRWPSIDSRFGLIGGGRMASVRPIDHGWNVQRAVRLFPRRDVRPL